MKKKQIIVDLFVVAVFVALAIFCYKEGKAYDILIDNGIFAYEGNNYEPLEAILVTVDDESEPMFLVDGDRGVATIVGKSHRLLVQELDEDDNITNTYKLKFKTSQIKGDTISIPAMLNKLPLWSFDGRKK